MNFVKFETKHFDELNNTTLRVFRDSRYLSEFLTDLNLGLNKTRNTAMLEVIAAK